MSKVFISGFEIDCATAVNPVFPSQVTEYPIESGANRADHVRLQPVQLAIEGIISDTPLPDLATRRTSLQVLGTLSANNKRPISAAAHAFFLKIRESREPVTVITERQKFENMVLETYDPPENADTGDALRFSATFKQIAIVVNKFQPRTAQPRHRKKRNLGYKAGTGAPTPLNWTAVDDPARGQSRRVIPTQGPVRNPLEAAALNQPAWTAPVPQQSFKSGAFPLGGS